MNTTAAPGAGAAGGAGKAASSSAPAMDGKAVAKRLQVGARAATCSAQPQHAPLRDTQCSVDDLALCMRHLVSYETVDFVMRQ
jgi:hypothetical protein